jgi:hypothetical protein
MLTIIRLAIAASMLLVVPAIALSKTPPARSPAPKPSTVAGDRDTPACYVQNPDSTFQDLSHLCGQKKPKPAPPTNIDKVPICYGLDDQYFPCPSAGD